MFDLCYVFEGQMQLSLVFATVKASEKLGNVEHLGQNNIMEKSHGKLNKLALISQYESEISGMYGNDLAIFKARHAQL